MSKVTNRKAVIDITFAVRQSQRTSATRKIMSQVMSVINGRHLGNQHLVELDHLIFFL